MPDLKRQLSMEELIKKSTLIKGKYNQSFSEDFKKEKVKEMERGVLEPANGAILQVILFNEIIINLQTVLFY